MKKYNTLLFDIDDTLLDFGAAEKLALNSLFEEQEIPLTPEIEEHYKRINKSLWQSYEKGSISRNEVINTRFSILFKEYGRAVDGISLENRYRYYLEQGHQLMDGAYDLIKDLQHHYDLFIVTNGVSSTQDKRLRDSGLFPFFKKVFVSEDAGFQKPTREFFDYVFKNIPHFDANKGLIVGDSISADIQGGYWAGLDTCWFNPDLKPNHTDLQPTYQIRELKELKQILTANKQ